MKPEDALKFAASEYPPQTRTVIECACTSSEELGSKSYDLSDGWEVRWKAAGWCEIKQYPRGSRTVRVFAKTGEAQNDF